MTDRVPLRTTLLYALPAFALAVVGIPVFVHIPKFYTDVIGVPALQVGIILAAMRIFDAVTDPLIGVASDRTTLSWGRRLPYVAVFCVPLALSLRLLFVPGGVTGNAATLWFTLFMATLFLFWTLVSVPYEALGPEISSDYDERTRIMGLRDGALLLGTLAAAVAPVIIRQVMHLPPSAAGMREQMRIFSVLYAPLIVITCLLCAWKVPERISREPRTEPVNWAAMRANRPFLVLLAAYTVSAFGSNLPATLILYYVEYVLQSHRADLFLLLYFATGILCLPAWVAAARRFEKKSAWLAAMAVNTGTFGLVFFLGPGQEHLYAVLVVLSGIGFGATLALPSAMQADVIDIHEQTTGQRCEGQYIGVWAISKKLAAALGVGIALGLLGLSGYTPAAVQPPRVVLILRLLYAAVPALCNLAAIGIALQYPITRAAHADLLEQIRKKKG